MAFTVGDTAPPLTGACKNGTGDSTGCTPNPAAATPANLSGAVVVLHIDRDGAPLLTKTPIVTDAMLGKWSYDWAVGDLIVDGMYRVEAEVTYAGGQIQTFGPAAFRVKRQIA